MKRATMKNWILTLGLCATVPFAGAALADSYRGDETKGILKSSSSGQLSRDVWGGMNRSDVLLLIDALPESYDSSVYYDLARRLLLSDAPSVSGGRAPAAKDGEKAPERADVLIARLDKLMEMGAILDAEKLYNDVVDDFPTDFTLAQRGLEILMLRGQFSAACLDLQAMSSDHAKDPRWQELTSLCKIMQAKGEERSRLVAQTSFKEFPQLQEMVRGRASNLGKFGPQDMAFAVATGNISDEVLRAQAQSAARLSPLLLGVLLQHPTEAQLPERYCLASEGLRRGQLTIDNAIEMYEKPHFESVQLTNINGPLDVHPCLVPPLLYQRVGAHKDKESRNQAIAAAFAAGRNLAPSALWPLKGYLADFVPQSNVDIAWPVVSSAIASGIRIPSTWGKGWDQEGKPGIAPFWPLLAITDGNVDQSGQLKAWRAQWPRTAARLDDRDPALPLMLDRAIAGKRRSDGGQNNMQYDTVFSLTFSRKYAMPSWGLTQRLDETVENGQLGQAVALFLIGYGQAKPREIAPDQLSLIIDGLSRGGAREAARMLALQALN